MPEEIAMPPLPEGTTEWATDLKKLRETHEEAKVAANKTPAVVIEALEPGKVRVAGRSLHTFTLQTYRNLVRLKSPFAEKQEGSEITVEEIVQALWVMVEDDEKVRHAIRTGGDFLEVKVAEFASAIPMTELGIVAEAIGLHVARSFGPAANLNPPATEGGASPLDATSSATAPAGS